MNLVVVYELGAPGLDSQVGGIDEGTNLLVVGGSADSKNEAGRAVVARGVERGDAILRVSTRYTTEELLEEYSDLDFEDSRFGVVDSVSHSVGGDVEESATVKHTSSPSDVTGIGIKVSDLIEKFQEDPEVERTRLYMDSISTLLMYSELQTVFRFLHVLTGRVRSIGGLGLYTMDPDMHDERDYSTLVQLFDATIEVRDADPVEARLTGGLDADWTELD